MFYRIGMNIFQIVDFTDSFAVSVDSNGTMYSVEIGKFPTDSHFFTALSEFLKHS